MKGRLTASLEGCVTLAIILVLIQTVLEDVLVLSGASWMMRRLLLFSGFAFDVFFTAEFLIRFWAAVMKRSMKRYLLHENGWVDFAASIPLLLFTSGPVFFAELSVEVFVGSGALIGLLKVVKAVRMARVLRLLRLLKIFRRIRFADSRMVQRHTVRIVTTAAAASIFAATMMGTVFAFVESRGTEEVWLEEQQLTSGIFSENGDDVRVLAAASPSLILLKNGGRTLYAAYDDAYLETRFGPADFVMYQEGGYDVWFDSRPAAVSQSRMNLTVFASTLIVVLLIVLTYSPHFAMTVSDPVNVMARGLSERSYNLEVKVPDELSDDDIFRLGQAYNEEYLPLKERSSADHSSPGALDISLDDISDLLKS